MTPQEVLKRIHLHINKMFESEAFIIIDALEKQIPQKTNTKFYNDGSAEYICPICEGAVNDDQKFCDECGQALYWED